MKVILNNFITQIENEKIIIQVLMKFLVNADQAICLPFVKLCIFQTW